MTNQDCPSLRPQMALSFSLFSNSHTCPREVKRAHSRGGIAQDTVPADDSPVCTPIFIFIRVSVTGKELLALLPCTCLRVEEKTAAPTLNHPDRAIRVCDGRVWGGCADDFAHL